MSENKVVPAKLPSNQFDHFYRGGDRIGALRHGPGGPMRPEEWIGSVTTRFGEAEQGLSKLPDGTFLKDAIASDPIAWLGDEHFSHFGLSIEVLVKLLDPDQRLPVHFHPNKAFAKQHLGLDHGKTEAWIILEAPAGSGVELQEPTDLSALLEWEGFAVDGNKDGHLGLGFETVTDALMLDPLSDSEFDSLVLRNIFSGGALRSVLPIKADGYFRAHLAPGGGDFESGFAIGLVLDGTGEITFADAPGMQITKGDALVIPHAAGTFTISGANVIICRPPLAELAKTAL